jgi:hypothetical protein
LVQVRGCESKVRATDAMREKERDALLEWQQQVHALRNK